MKLPRLTAEFSVGAATGIYRNGPVGGARAALVPMASISCLSGCVGTSTALHCSAVCSNQADAAGEEACWQRCAGSTNPGCIQSCFQPASATR
jgi:hypothetical protein